MSMVKADVLPYVRNGFFFLLKPPSLCLSENRGVLLYVKCGALPFLVDSVNMYFLELVMCMFYINSELMACIL